MTMKHFLGSGGAIYATSQALAIRGNLFQENNASTFKVERKTGALVVATEGYNVSNVAGGTGTAASGWAFKTDPAADKMLTVSFDSDFKPSATGLSVVQASALSGFPTTYFDGAARGSTPGAMPAN